MLLFLKLDVEVVDLLWDVGCNFAKTRRFLYFGVFIFVTPWSNFIIIYEACCHAINSWWCIPLLWENRFSDLCHHSRGWLMTDHSIEVVLWASLFVSKLRYLCVRNFGEGSYIREWLWIYFYFSFLKVPSNKLVYHLLCLRHGRCWSYYDVCRSWRTQFCCRWTLMVSNWP